VSHFLLIASDASTQFSAFEVANHRIKKQVWPIYKGTRNRNAIASGDVVWFYLGGKKQFRQCIVARASVKSVESQGRRVAIIDREAALTEPPFKILQLCNVQYFQPPIEIRPLIGKLSFLPDKPKWGAPLVGGCRRIPTADADLIGQQRQRKD
jgi:hypothetical protein